MFDGKTIIGLSLGYVCLLFLIAWAGDRYKSSLGSSGRPVIYALSLAVYCTSWTFFGSVGLAARTGYDFLPIYIGPILVFAFGWRIITRIVRLAKGQNLTSVADFMAARYGKSAEVAAIVALIALAGTLPYIALQLKAVAVSVETLLGRSPFGDLMHGEVVPIDTAFVVTLALAVFAVLFGTRHIDATEHQHGLMLAIAAESLVKLAAFVTVGAFVTFWVFGSIDGLAIRAGQSLELKGVFGQGFNGGNWLTMLLLSSVCILLLPRQFHVTVVENNSETEIRRASWLFPLYLVLINIFVIPIAAAGLILLPANIVDQDMYVLALPMWANADYMTMLAFIGGLSAATAMVIVECVALAIMLCNGVIVPLLLRHRVVEEQPVEDVSEMLLLVRRVVILLILMLGYAVYRALGQAHGLASIGLIAFAAIAQLAPAFFGGLLWRRATAKGAIAAILSGFGVWSYTLLLPWIVKAGWLPASIVEHGPLGIGALRPQALFYMQFEPLTHGVLWSLAVNTVCYVVFSLLRAPEPIERLQANLFVVDDMPRGVPPAGFRLWRTSVTVGDLQQLAGRYLGTDRAQRSFAEYEVARGQPLAGHAEADIGSIRFTEYLLTSAIGAASSRLVMTLLLRRGDVGRQSDLRLLDDASEALQYSRDLLQSALDQVRHGLSVFDKDLRLICWNRQFRELLELPQDFGRVGITLERVLRILAERGDLGPGPIDQLVANRMMQLAVRHDTFQQRVGSIGRILEIRTSPMPQGGIVTTYSDITERVEAATALAQANESLEGRVIERTAELTKVNAELTVAKASAEAANLDKTRFLAAASHDILQPLNAARLYSSSLSEALARGAPIDAPAIARNIDASLGAVEDILSTLLDISRLDSGNLQPDVAAFPLQSVFDQLTVEFQPLAGERRLALRFVPTSIWLLSDRRLLRRVLQNLVSNAIKYTPAGSVLVGCRRRGGMVAIEVLDTGPGIPEEKRELIFKEFQRLEETASSVKGLGLGLAIVERICRVLGTPISVHSRLGHGSRFTVDVPVAEAASWQKRVEPQQDRSTGLGVNLGGMLVVCIDNEPDVLNGMRLLLTGWGCNVLLASSPETAAQAVTSAGQVPEVILADYHLDKATGLDAIAAVRKAARTPIPAVIITADQSPGLQKAIRAAGYGLLSKPLKAGALRAILAQQALRRAAAE